MSAGNTVEKRKGKKEKREKEKKEKTRSYSSRKLKLPRQPSSKKLFYVGF
jgi:hypothetical protein